ncbi:YsnF/AvaK domain-containing protein [uncultured Hymenobacter sp.]|uniref:YsnF/AvaK domain-containing protein n=1 Tax=uncultured Hymenobacter sp. TaxID=170016 RepID=UPI0035C9E49D
MQTVVGIFDNAAQAQQASQQLAAAGFSLENVDVASSGAYAGGQSGNTLSQAARPDRDPSDYQNNSGTVTEGAADAAGRTGDGIGNFFSNLFGGSDSDETQRYSHVARQSSSSIVTVHVQTAEHARKAAEILDAAGAVDVDQRAAETGYQSQGNSYAANTGTTDNAGMTAQVIEENLQVGKRVEETGGVRLRSRIVEKPVEAHVRLREEHVTVQRNPVNRPATDADFNTFKEGQIEITESAERAVVGKEARVVEEISLGKEVTEREEVVRDTVRKTEVDVEQIPGSTTRTTGTSTGSTSSTDNSRNS